MTTPVALTFNEGKSKPSHLMPLRKDGMNQFSSDSFEYMSLGVK